MLTGQAPYQATTAKETAVAHLKQPVPSVRVFKADLPSGCQEIIDKVMAKDPAQRYQTAGKLAKDVKEMVSGRWVLRRLYDIG